ncbi:MAG: hypothetical protein HY319_23215 [Armatimonadetes bacterium]|nr:hypothetical protein [Armatimonadota bacterium]
MVASRFYFAHPTTMYDTPVEREIEAAFRRQFPGAEVENPNQPQHSEGYQREGMEYFVHLCDSLDGVFFAPHSEGSVGAGVAREVGSFADRHAPVQYFDPVRKEFVTADDGLGRFNVLDVDHTRALIREERALKAAGQSPFDSLEGYGRRVAGWRPVDALA